MFNVRSNMWTTTSARLAQPATRREIIEKRVKH